MRKMADYGVRVKLAVIVNYSSQQTDSDSDCNDFPSLLKNVASVAKQYDQVSEGDGTHHVQGHRKLKRR